MGKKVEHLADGGDMNVAVGKPSIACNMPVQILLFTIGWLVDAVTMAATKKEPKWTGNWGDILTSSHHGQERMEY